MSEKLVDALKTISQKEKITLGDIIDDLGKDSVMILCLIVIFPFLQPIPIPGISTLLGLIVLMQGFGLIINGKPFLTKRMFHVVIEEDNWKIIYKAGMKFNFYIGRLSSFKHPWANSRFSQVLAGISIILSAAFLSLPLPIPFSNFIPAISIMFICLGLLEEDLILLIIGHLIMIALAILIAYSYKLIAEQAHQGIDYLMNFLFSLG